MLGSTSVVDLQYEFSRMLASQLTTIFADADGPAIHEQHSGAGVGALRWLSIRRDQLAYQLVDGGPSSASAPSQDVLVPTVHGRTTAPANV
jgi:hypothetical protein